MRRNCSIAIVVWILLVAGYGYFLWPHVRAEARWIVPLVMASVVWSGLALVHGSRYEWRDWRARNRLARGERPQDGDLVSAIGVLRPVFATLRAPFSDRECVLYAYEIAPPSSRRGSPARDYAGFGMVPCEVHTPYGVFRLGSFPVLDRVRQQSDPARGDAYVRATTFEELSLAMVARRIFEIHTQAPPVRVDWQVGEPSNHPGMQYFEQILALGQTITAIGRYVSATNSIVSDTLDKGYLRVRPGGDPHDASTFPAAAVKTLLGGIAIVAAANGVMWWLLTITPR